MKKKTTKKATNMLNNIKTTLADDVDIFFGKSFKTSDIQN